MCPGGAAAAERGHKVPWADTAGKGPERPIPAGVAMKGLEDVDMDSEKAEE